MCFCVSTRTSFERTNVQTKRSGLCPTVISFQWLCPQKSKPRLGLGGNSPIEKSRCQQDSHPPDLPLHLNFKLQSTTNKSGSQHDSHPSYYLSSTYLISNFRLGTTNASRSPILLTTSFKDTLPVNYNYMPEWILLPCFTMFWNFPQEMKQVSDIDTSAFQVVAFSSLKLYLMVKMVHLHLRRIVCDDLVKRQCSPS